MKIVSVVLAICLMGTSAVSQKASSAEPDDTRPESIQKKIRDQVSVVWAMLNQEKDGMVYGVSLSVETGENITTFVAAIFERNGNQIQYLHDLTLPDDPSGDDDLFVHIDELLKALHATALAWQQEGKLATAVQMNVYWTLGDDTNRKEFQKMVKKVDADLQSLPQDTADDPRPRALRGALFATEEGIKYAGIFAVFTEQYGEDLLSEYRIVSAYPLTLTPEPETLFSIQHDIAAERRLEGLAPFVNLHQISTKPPTPRRRLYPS